MKMRDVFDVDDSGEIETDEIRRVRKICPRIREGMD